MIYADYNGSAPLLPSVREHLKRRLESDLFANPNAIHSLGQKLFKGIERCREIIAEAIGCYPDQLFFNSGASEGITTVLNSVLANAPISKKIIITSSIEHAIVLATLEHFVKKYGFQVKLVDVDSEGQVLLSSLESLLQEFKNETALVTIMAANNETGVIQDYEEIAKICGHHQVEFFSDTTQLIGKAEFNFQNSRIDYAICSGHKLGALTGTGLIIIKEPAKLQPLIFGKGQENGLRGGTQHYLGIETLALAFQDFVLHKHKLPALNKARLNFERALKDAFKDLIIIGENAERISGTSLIGLPGLHGQALQIELESNDIFVTTSAACSDNQPETSNVLKAMKIDERLGRSVVRISLSYLHGEQEYSALARALKQAYNKLIKIHSF